MSNVRTMCPLPRYSLEIHFSAFIVKDTSMLSTDSHALLGVCPPPRRGMVRQRQESLPTQDQESPHDSVEDGLPLKFGGERLRASDAADDDSCGCLEFMVIRPSEEVICAAPEWSMGGSSLSDFSLSVRNSER
jgi:hypothetical protein